MSMWSNFLHSFRVMAAGAALTALWSAAPPALAQEQQQQRLTDRQLQQLVAPVALYPDPLLAQIFTASTYPLELVMAARWSKDNPNLKGQELENAMQQQSWDASVKGLAAVPQVLAMMNDKLDWTQQLGEAFLAQPDDVTKAVQALRTKAEATGNLKSTKELKVRRVAAPPPSPGEEVVLPEYIVIEPFEPEVLYVPIYDPVIIFGVGYWPDAYVPFFWYPPWWSVGPVWGFWPAYYVGPALWCQYNWYSASIHINVALYSKFNHVKIVNAAAFQKWQHDPLHHQGVPYKNVALQHKFSNVNTGHNLKQNVNLNLKNNNLNLKQNPSLNLKQNPNLGNKNKLNANLGTNKLNTNKLNTNKLNNNLGTGNKKLGTGNTKNLHTNLTTGNKSNYSGSNKINQQNFNQQKFNQQKFNQQKFTNTQNVNRVQNINRTPGPVSGGNKPVNPSGPPQKQHHP